MTRYRIENAEAGSIDYYDQADALTCLHIFGVYPIDPKGDLSGDWQEGRIVVQRDESAYISVLTRSSRHEVQAYLYSGMIVLEVDDNAGGRGWTAMVVQANSRGAAEYQAERLASGLIGAKVHDTRAEAENHLATIV